LIRGYAAEFGITAARGLDKIEPLLARIATAADVPELAKELFATLAEQYGELKPKLRSIDAQLLAWHRHNELSRRLAQVPAIGPIGAALLAMKVPDQSRGRRATDARTPPHRNPMSPSAKSTRKFRDKEHRRPFLIAFALEARPY
jgi:transposase